MEYYIVSGQSNALEELMASGCPFDVPEKNGATPLHLATQASASPTGCPCSVYLHTMFTINLTQYLFIFGLIYIHR